MQRRFIRKLGDQHRHHLFAKGAFKGTSYDENVALALSNSELDRLGLTHIGSQNAITTIQGRLYRDFNALHAGRVPSLDDMAKIELRALIEAGADPADATDMIGLAFDQLKRLGVTPIRNPFVR